MPEVGRGLPGAREVTQGAVERPPVLLTVTPGQGEPAVGHPSAGHGEVDLVLADFAEVTHLGCHALGQRLTELTQLDQGGVRLTPKIALGQSAQRDKLRGMSSKKAEIG